MMCARDIYPTLTGYFSHNIKIDANMSNSVATELKNLINKLPLNQKKLLCDFAQGYVARGHQLKSSEIESLRTLMTDIYSQTKPQNHELVLLLEPGSCVALLETYAAQIFFRKKQKIDNFPQSHC